MNIRFTLCTLAVVALCASPLSAQSREQRQMMATLQILQEQAQQLAISITALQQALDESTKALNGRIDETNNAMRKGFADQKLTTDAIANDLNKVRATSDDVNVRVGSLREEVEALRLSVLPLLTAPPPPPDAAQSTTGAPPTPPAPVTLPPTRSVGGLSPTRMFEEARTDYFQGRYDVAITGLEQFLKTFPDSGMADDAQFLIGESYFLQNRWADALAAYTQVIQAYPRETTVADALYKRGLAHERLNQLDQARASWQTAVTTYPESDAGRLAKQNLDRLAARRP